MIKLIHRYKQSIGIVFLFVAFCFALSGVGIDILHGGSGRDRYAISIDDHTISQRELQTAERRLERQYQNMFGQNYAQLAQSLGLNLTRQAMDSLIDSYLVEREAREIGFEAGREEIKRYIRSELFDQGNGFSADQYRAMLQGMGMSAGQFEAQVARDVVRTSLTELLNDVAFLSTKDIESRLARQETKYTVLVARYTAGSLLGDVPAPTDDALKAYYDSNATDYEKPARVSYEYVVLAPKDFEKDVPVSAQDVEFAYSEEAQKYKTAEQARIRSIKVLYPKESDPSKMASAREKAKSAYAEATAGKPFETVVATYSEDLPTKLAGGVRGWVEKGKGSQSFDKAVFETPAGGVAPLVEADWGFEIVKVEEKKPSGQRSLDEVRGEIEGEIRKREAPAFAAAKAQELLAKSRNRGASFADILKEAGLSLTGTDGLLDETKDPGLSLSGLTKKVLEMPSGDRAVPVALDMGENSVLVQVKDFKDTETAPFEEVKDKVAQAVKSAEAKKLASQRAQELFDGLKGSDKALKALAEEKKASVGEPAEITRSNPTSPKLTGVPDDLTAEVFKITTTPALLDRVFQSGDVFLIGQVTAIQRPDLSTPEMKTKLEEFRSQATQEASRTMIESTISRLKLDSEIDIDETLLVR